MPPSSTLVLFCSAALVLLIIPGPSVFLVSSALAFNAAKYLGAAYLLGLGVRRGRAGDDLGPAADRPGLPMADLFRQGFVVQVLNPKTAMFFLAFLPQFIDPRSGSVALQARSAIPSVPR